MLNAIKNQSFFKQITTPLREGVIVLDQLGTIYATNQAITELFGYTEEELLGSNVTSLMSEEYKKTYNEFIRNYMKAGEESIQDFGNDAEGKHKNGSLFPAQLKVSKIDFEAASYFMCVIHSLEDETIKAEQIKDQASLLERAEKIAKLGHWRVDLVKQEVFWSKEIYRIHGVNPETYQPQLDSAVDFYRKQDRKMVQDYLEECIKTKSDFTFEAQIVRPSGELRHVRSSGECIINKKGEVTSIFGAFQDITEQTKEEKIMNEVYRITTDDDLFYEDKMYQMLEAGKKYFGLELGIISQIQWRDYVVQFVSENDELQSGATFDLQGTYCAHTFGSRAVKAWHNAGESEIARHPCYKNFGLNAYIGTTIYVNNIAYGTLNFTSTKPRQTFFSEREKSFINLIAQYVGNEISKELNRLEREELIEDLEDVNEELSKSQNFQEMIMNSIPDLIFVKDPKLRIVQANDAFLNLYPKEKRDLVIGSTTAEEYDADEAEEFFKYDKIALKTGYSENEEEIHFPNGDRKILFTKKVRFESDNDEQFALGIARDITAQKKIENSLRQANEELEEFTYRTSHDLRSPLVSSISLLSMAQDSIKENDLDTAMKSLGHIEASLLKLEALIKDILSLTQAQNIEEENTEIDIQDAIYSALFKFSNMKNYERLDITTDLQFTEPVINKKSRFLLIVENLLSNAIKYQDENEEQSYIKISTYKEGRNFVFQVQDNGLGIPEEQHEKIFQMFKRFHNRVAFGSGLGLYMMKKSAGILGGDILFEQPKKGTIFKLVIPL